MYFEPLFTFITRGMNYKVSIRREEHTHGMNWTTFSTTDSTNAVYGERARRSSQLCVNLNYPQSYAQTECGLASGGPALPRTKC